MNAPNPIPFAPEGPQPLVREIATGMAYPAAHLGPLRAAVEAVQGMTQAPVAIPAASALAVASLAVQGFADVDTLGGPRPVSLYALTIARSGERKSSCASSSESRPAPSVTHMQAGRTPRRFGRASATASLPTRRRARARNG